MTNQELFDRVSKHLLEQNNTARAGGKGVCVYFDEETGRKCAIGCLIPKEKYHWDLEGVMANNPEVMEAAGLVNENLDLACDLQALHDSSPVPLWATELERIARKYGLRQSVLA